MKSLFQDLTPKGLAVGLLAFAALGAQAAEGESPVKFVGSISVKTDDPQQSGQFFADVLEFDRHSSDADLGVEYFQLPSGQYFHLMTAEAANAEVYKTPLIGFGVDNIDEARQTLESNGLAFEGETQKTPSGGRAFFKDVEGNLMEVVQNPPTQDFDQQDKKLQVFAIGWVGVDVDDHAESFQFFNEKFGFTEIPLRGGGNPFTLMGFEDDTYFEVLNYLGGDYPEVAFQVKDVRAGVEVLKERGVKLIGGIGGPPGLTTQKFEGPDGIVYLLAEIIPQS